MEETITGAKGRALQRRKPKSGGRLSAKARRTFLDHLAATCNVQASAAAAGSARTAAFYRLRGDDDGFAAAWRDAMRIGYERLEEALLARALEQVGGADDDRNEDRPDPDAVAIELVDRPPADAAAGAAPDRAGLRIAAGLPTAIARVDVQLALALLNRQAAIDRKGPERRRRRATAQEVEDALAVKLDRLAERLAGMAG